jgi:ferredoxin--NADP+ reductase
MNRIVRKRDLAASTRLIEIENPVLASKVRPGQFMMVMSGETGERIPLTAADWDVQRGTVSIVFLEVGASTRKLGMLSEGEELYHLAGPLGNPTEIERLERVVVVGGGVGIATAYPVARAFKEAGSHVISIIGARSADKLIFKEKVESVSDEFRVATDDGSEGRKGFVSDVLREILQTGEKVDRVFTVGPTIMMKVVADTTKPFGVKTVASLNPIMLCGMGMCGGCRVHVAGEVKFACVDGPDFDAAEVDFRELLARLSQYRTEEGMASQLLNQRQVA